jgi:hypothetical protein
MVISCKHDDESWWIMMNHDASWWFIGFGEGFNHNYSRMKPTVMGISWHHVSKLYLDGELTSNLWPCYAMLGKWFNFREHRGHRRSSVCWDGNKMEQTQNHQQVTVGTLPANQDDNHTRVPEIVDIWFLLPTCSMSTSDHIFVLIQQINMCLNNLKLHIICMYLQHKSKIWTQRKLLSPKLTVRPWKISVDV